MPEMTTNQKALAMQALRDFSLHIRPDQSWYLLQSGVMELVGEGLRRSVGGDGETPEEAVENAWLNLQGKVIEVNLLGVGGYKHFKWNGFMWAEQERKD